MMNHPLNKRQGDLVEWMDRHDCDPVILDRTYRNFSIVNHLLSGWDRLYRHHLRPLMNRGQTWKLLDVGCGGGDITRKIAAWAQRDGLDLVVTGVDPDPRAIRFALANSRENRRLRFRQTDSYSLLDEGKRYDFVISNHVLHHLDEKMLPDFLESLRGLAVRKVICSDIERSATGYALFSAATLLLFRGSYIREDGRISIKKSYTHKELSAMVSVRWKVFRQFPFRLLAIHEP